MFWVNMFNCSFELCWSMQKKKYCAPRMLCYHYSGLSAFDSCAVSEHLFKHMLAAKRQLCTNILYLEVLIVSGLLFLWALLKHAHYQKKNHCAPRMLCYHSSAVPAFGPYEVPYHLFKHMFVTKWHLAPIVNLELLTVSHLLLLEYVLEQTSQDLLTRKLPAWKWSTVHQECTTFQGCKLQVHTYFQITLNCWLVLANCSYELCSSTLPRKYCAQKCYHFSRMQVWCPHMVPNQLFSGQQFLPSLFKHTMPKSILYAPRMLPWWMRTILLSTCFSIKLATSWSRHAIMKGILCIIE